jgi:putative Ca2+/H+ antiporter (TMEM165/GDT1 family)
MAGGYQIVANAEKRAANIWRWITVGALLGAIAATIFAVAHGIENGFHVNTFFAKWAISVPFAALAAYAGHESSKHREQERLNRKIELQLASLDAYLVTLEDGKQADIREKLADRFFGDLPIEVEPGVDTPG